MTVVVYAVNTNPDFLEGDTPEEEGIRFDDSDMEVLEGAYGEGL